MDKAQNHELSLLRDALRLAGVGVWTLEVETQSFLWTEEVFRLYEISPQNATPSLNLTLSCFAPEAQPQLEGAMQRALAHGVPWNLEMPFFTTRGRTLWVRSRGQPEIRQGACVRLIGTFEEIPSPASAGAHGLPLNELDTSQLALIARHTHDLLLVTDARDQIEWVNTRFTEVTGYTLLEARGRSPRELLGQPQPTLSSEPIFQGKESGGAMRHGVELKLFKRDGSPYWVEVDVLPVVDATGQPRQFIHVQRDITARHEAEAQKTLLHERFTLLSQGAGVGYAERDLESGLGYWDQQCFALHGMPQGIHAPSSEWLEALVLPEDRERYRHHDENLRNAATPIDIEYRIRKPDGSLAWIHLRAWCEADVEGRPLRSVAMLMDVSARHHTEQLLQATRARLELTSSGAGVGLFEENVETKALYWSNECFELFGVPTSPSSPSSPSSPPQPLSWDSVMQHVHPDDRNLFTQQWQILRKAAQFTDIEFRILRPHSHTAAPPAHSEAHSDTEERWLLLRGRLNLDGAHALVVGVVIDVTELRKTQKTLQDARDRLTLAAQASRIATWEHNLVTNTGQWDALMFRFHGLTPGAGGAQAPRLDALTPLLHPDDAPRFMQALQQVQTRRKALEWEYRVVRPQGQILHLLTRARTQFGPDGTPLRVVGATLDVSDSRRTSERLREALSRLRIATEAAGVGTFERDLATGSGRWDAAMTRLWGLPPTVQTPTFEQALLMIVPQDRIAVSAALQRATTVDHAIEFEYRIHRGDGKLAVLNTRGRAERSEDGTPVRIVGATVDVTASREAQVQLREFNEWMQLSSQATGVGFFRRSADGNTIFADRQMRVHYGLELDGPTPTPTDVKRNVLPEDLPLLDAAHQEALTNDGSPVEVEYRVRDPDTGAIRYLFTRRVRIDAQDGRDTTIVGAVLDVTESRAAQRALATASERLGLATRTAGMGIWEWDLVSGEEVWDARMREIYAISDAQWHPNLENWLALLHPEDRERAARPFVSDMQQISSGESEYRVLCPKGEIRSVLGSYVIERNSAGQPVRMLGTDLDITEARRTQNERDALSRRLDLMASEVGIGMWEWDLQRNTTVWNTQMYSLFGRSVDQFSNYNWLDFVHEEDREQAQRQIDTALQEGTLLQSRFRVLWPDGSLHWMASRARVERDTHGQPLRMVGANWDVTDLFRSDQERQQLSERINMAVTMAGLGFWHFVPGQPTPYVDDRTITLYGRTRAEDPDFASHWLDYVHPEDLSRMSLSAARLTHTNEPVETEFRILLPDGRVRHLAVRARRSIAADGRGAVVNGVNWDVTEQRLAENALRAQETAERASAAKTEFLSRMSHELRTPLNAVLGFAQVMEIDGRNPLNETQQSRLTHIQKAGWHLLALINEILDLSRIEAGKTQLNMAAVSISEVVDECMSLVLPEATRRQVLLHHELNEKSPSHVWADRVRFKQVLLNLLSNAVKYNRDNGSVYVRAHTSEQGEVVVGVRDTGAGLTETQMAEIFEPFNRLGRDASSNDGTGIGLTISLKLTQQMGGTLTVSSTPGSGSEFFITLRATPILTTPSGAPSAEDSKTLIRTDIVGSVLYIGDHAEHVALIEKALSLRPSVQLFVAPDGTTAGVLAAVCQPDLALMELELPDIAGSQLLTQIHATEATRDVNCIALSPQAHADAAAQTNATAQARQAGFIDLWASPLDTDQLLRGIDSWLSRRNLPLH